MKKIVYLSLLVGLVLGGSRVVLACPDGMCERHDSHHHHQSMILGHAKELGLSKDQITKIKGMQKNFEAEMKKIWKKHHAEITAVLTKEQKKKLEELKNHDNEE